MSRGDDNLVTIDYDEIVTDTDDAILIRVGLEDIWIPRSQISNHDEVANEMDIPEWLALNEGLI